VPQYQLSLKAEFLNRILQVQEILYRLSGLKYTVPEETGINAEDLLPIDEIVREAIK
jgi:hypothetical protein